MVDYIVLNNVTGNAYEYGMMVGTTVHQDRFWMKTTTEEGRKRKII